MPGAAPPPDGPLSLLDLVAVRRWAVLTRSLFAARRAEIDALNVFPVPDGDTGTNLYLTFDGAVERTLATADVTTADALLAVFARHLLWTARGNSGVILSQLARGLAEGCAGAAEIDGRVLAEGLQHAEQRARQAVTDPKEGTILTVARAMAEAAARAAGSTAPGSYAVTDGAGDPDPGAPATGDGPVGVHAVALAALDASREALEHTPEQLEVLARAGVVDAGGAGLVVLLECLERVCAGQRARSGSDASDRRARRRPDPRSAALSAARPADGAEAPGIPEFEVMYLLRDSDDTAVDALRARLVELGDSVLVVGGDGEWNVHAHVDDAGAAVEAGIEAGRPHRVRITRLTDEHGHGTRGPRVDNAGTSAVRGAAIVACAAGVGLEGLFEDAGAVVVRSGPGRRASTGGLIDAIRQQHARGASGVVVLPNDGDTLLAAAAAVRAVADDGIEAHLVHVRTAVQGIAALAVFEPTAAASANVLAMQAAASATRHGAVTVANRAALTSGGPCEAGDVLGVVDGDVVIVGSDQLDVSRQVVQRLLASGGELLTVVAGVDAPDGLLEAVTAEARVAHHGIEVSLLDGGQAVYPVLLGVE
ncbi:DAK2 domain fusion protein YloV [Terrabacter sp. Root85]|uniref:DAK2 domain-containing protein n=1 Tax=Terrabacter sp. Root85 TaxID=1736603 RepID=UPI0006F73A22|nr:DAK2 domain-containing protein [Terrabacter sp. Root85]KRC89457.1 DAK2 domain fusion protein YloV [Terrabacter sp. Root85]